MHVQLHSRTIDANDANIRAVAEPCQSRSANWAVATHVRAMPVNTSSRMTGIWRTGK